MLMTLLQCFIVIVKQIKLAVVVIANQLLTRHSLYLAPRMNSNTSSF